MERPLVIPMDTTVVVEIDSTILGREIYDLIPSCVQINRSAEVAQAEQTRREFNVEHRVPAYKIRIFFDNGQNARSAAGGALGTFKSLYPKTPAVISFENSYFKVTVGNYRTKTDANRILRKLKPIFPMAFIVEDEVKYPDF